MQVLHIFIFNAIRSARFMGEPSITDIFGRFFKRGHSLRKIRGIRLPSWLVEIIYLLMNSMLPRMTTCLRSLNETLDALRGIMRFLNELIKTNLERFVPCLKP